MGLTSVRFNASSPAFAAGKAPKSHAKSILGNLIGAPADIILPPRRKNLQPAELLLKKTPEPDAGSRFSVNA